MYVSKQEFESFKAEVNSSFERLQSDIKSSYASITHYFERLELHIDERFNALDGKFNALDEKFNILDEKFNILDEKFNVLDKKFDVLDKKVERMDVRLGQVGDDLWQLRSNFGARFDVITGQLRIVDQGQFRVDERLSTLERRVGLLENKAS